MNQKDLPITINKNTLIPIGLVISIGAVIWFAASVYAQVQQNTKDIATFLEIAQNLNENLVKTNNNVIELNTLLKNRGN